MAPEQTTKLPPQNLEAEQAVLGGMLIDNDAINRVVEVVSPDDFYRDAHQKIFGAIIELYNKSEPSDLVTLTDTLKARGELDSVGGASYLAALVDGVPTAANVASYSKIVREKAVLRQLITGATDIVTRGYEEKGDVDEFLDDAEKVVFEIAQRRVGAGFSSVREIVRDSFKAIEALYEKKALITGVSTGFKELDRITSGLQKSDLIIIAGRPSMGKTAFALNVAENAAVDGQKVCAVFSLEMSREQLVQRMLCSRGEVDAQKLRGGFLSESDWPKLTRAAGILSESRLFIDDSPGLTVLEVRAKARRLQREHGLDLIMVDYIQLSDLRESGAIEQDADVIAFIYRDEMYNPSSPDAGKAEIIVGKQRNGPTGRVFLSFRKNYTRFDDLATGMDEFAPAPMGEEEGAVGEELPQF